MTLFSWFPLVSIISSLHSSGAARGSASTWDSFAFLAMSQNLPNRCPKMAGSWMVLLPNMIALSLLTHPHMVRKTIFFGVWYSTAMAPKWRRKPWGFWERGSWPYLWRNGQQRSCCSSNWIWKIKLLIWSSSFRSLSFNVFYLFRNRNKMCLEWMQRCSSHLAARRWNSYCQNNRIVFFVLRDWKKLIANDSYLLVLQNHGFCWSNPLFFYSKSINMSHKIHGAGIYANIGGIFMVNVIIYSIHGSYGCSTYHDFCPVSSPKSLSLTFPEASRSRRWHPNIQFLHRRSREFDSHKHVSGHNRWFLYQCEAPKRDVNVGLDSPASSL